MKLTYKKYSSTILCLVLLLHLTPVSTTESTDQNRSFQTQATATIPGMDAEPLSEEAVTVPEIEIEVAKGSLFDDVLDDAWYAPYVEQAYEHGFISGTGNNNFSPEKQLNYGEFAVMLSASYLGAEVTEQKFLYSGTLWADPYIATVEAVYKEIDPDYVQNLQGQPASAVVTRYQACELLAMLLQSKDLAPLTAEEYSQYSMDFEDTADYPYRHLLGITVEQSLMKGKTSRYFSGQDSLSRAEACVIVCGLLGVEELQQERYDPEKSPERILEKDKFTLPVIMYHSVLENREEHIGNSFVISPETLRSDLEYLTKHGYTGIFMSDLIDYVNNGGDLPEKPILLTFDDGYDNNYSQVLPLLEEYRMKAVVCIIGAFVEHQYADTLPPSSEADSETVPDTGETQEIESNSSPVDEEIVADTMELSEEQAENPEANPEPSIEPNPEPNLEENLGKDGFLLKHELLEMQNSGWVEFQCHTYDMHYSEERVGSLRLPGESLESYQALLRDDIEKNKVLFSNLGLKETTTFSYPGGKVNSDNRSVIQEIFIASFLTLPVKDNIITRGNYNCLHDLTRPNRDYGVSTEYFFKSVL